MTCGLVHRRDLVELGYHVIEARDGVEARGLLRAVPEISVLVSGRGHAGRR